MNPGGRAAIQGLKEEYAPLVDELDSSSGAEGRGWLLFGSVLLAVALLIVVLSIAGQTHQEQEVIPMLPMIGVFLAMGLILNSHNKDIVTRLRDGLPELKDYIRSVLFDGGIWRDIMEDDVDRDLKLGPVQIASVHERFEERLKRLFNDYPQLAAQKSLEPFPSWYRRMSSEPDARYRNARSKRFVVDCWKYALAQVLWDEFFGNAPDLEPAPVDEDCPELVEHQIGI